MVGGGALSNWKDGGNLLTASYPCNPNTCKPNTCNPKTWEARSKAHDSHEAVVLNAFTIGIQVKDA
jgi:hypothetical protein